MSRRYERFKRAVEEHHERLQKQVILEPIDWEVEGRWYERRIPRAIWVIAPLAIWFVVIVVYNSAQPVVVFDPPVLVVDDPYGSYIAELMENR